MYQKVVIIGFMAMLLVIAAFSWLLALFMFPFLVYYTIRKRPWLGEPHVEKVNRNYRLPLSRVRIPRMRMPK